MKNIHLLPMDLNQVEKTEFSIALSQIGFNNKLTTLFLWEGATYYFSPAVVSSILEIISVLADESYLIVDFANEGSFMQKKSENAVFSLSNEEISGVNQTLNVLEKRHEPWKGFFNSTSMGQYLKQLGFEPRIDWDHELENEYFDAVKMVPESMYYINASKKSR